MQRLFRSLKNKKQNSVTSMSETASVQSMNLNHEEKNEEPELEEMGRASREQENLEIEDPNESYNDLQPLIRPPTTRVTHRVKKKRLRPSKRHQVSQVLDESLEPPEIRPSTPPPPPKTEQNKMELEIARPHRDEDNAVEAVVPCLLEDNGTSAPEVTLLIEFFETRLAARKDEMTKVPFKTTAAHKRSQLTRKRSRSLATLYTSELVKEVAELQGDSIARVQSEKEPEKEKSVEDKENDAAKLLKQLLEVYKPKFVPPVDTAVYVVDTVQYDYKVSPCNSNIGPNLHLGEDIPRQALKRDDGTTRNPPWTGGKADKILQYLRNTVVNIGTDCYLTGTDSIPPISPSLESLLPKSTAESLGKKHAAMLSREWNPSFACPCLDKQGAEFGKSTPQGPSTFCLPRNDFGAGAKNIIPRIPVQYSSSTPCGNTSFDTFCNMSQQPSTSTDRNNNPKLLPSSSSSEESVLTSIRSNFLTTRIYPPRPEYQAEYPSEYAFKYRPPKIPAATYTISKTSTRDGSIFAGSGTEDDRCGMSHTSSSYRNYNGSSSELSEKNVLIEEATYAANALLSDLHTLWCCVSEKKKFPISSSKQGLLELVGLCSYVVKEMEGEWNSFASFYPDRKRLDELSKANRHLRERLEQATITENTLQADMGYLLKEKGMMATEVKELSMQLASSRRKHEQLPIPSFVHQHRSPSNCSMGFHLSMDPEAGNKAIKRREEDFNSLMEFVRVRGNDMTLYKEQLEQYDQEVDTLHRTIEVTKHKQLELETAYAKLTEDNKTIDRERGHYEQILKLILQEKQSDGSSLYELLQTLISKLNDMDGGTQNQDIGLLEGALKAVQEQNSNYRDEVQRLKEMLKNVSASCLAGKCQEEARRASSEYSSKLLDEKSEEVKQIIKVHEIKYGQLQAIHDLVSESKAKLDKAYDEKGRELKKTSDELSSLQKVTLRQQRKIQDLHKLNMDHTREIQEHNHNVENLNKIVLHLRSTLNEKNNEWSERLRMNGEEAIGMKDQCKWLQGQIDILTQQLADAHERMKGHERDKGCLAQQVLNAEEERKVIDRKLQELRAAFQGDAALRKALMERNEAMQVEIARLRRSKLMNLDMSMKANDESEYGAPPSEMSDAISLFPFSHSTQEEKHGPKKNRFTASVGYEEPRVVASTHSASDRLTK